VNEFIPDHTFPAEVLLEN